VHKSEKACLETIIGHPIHNGTRTFLFEFFFLHIDWNLEIQLGFYDKMTMTPIQIFTVLSKKLIFGVCSGIDNLLWWIICGSYSKS
jgi:hypothetical protein